MAGSRLSGRLQWGQSLVKERDMKSSPVVFVFVLVLVMIGAAGCVSRQSEMGVDNLWRGDPAPTFEIGLTTQSDVMDLLGPPSQVIALGERTLFYYLREQQKFESFSLIVYAQSKEQIGYDRAIFFFNPDGTLQDFALSQEAIPRGKKGSVD